MDETIILSVMERRVLDFIFDSSPSCSQSQIIENFVNNYNTPESARNVIGKLLERLKDYELIERVPNDGTKHRKNVNIWKVSQLGLLEANKSLIQ